jgi:acetyl esterase/lipase
MLIEPEDSEQTRRIRDGEHLYKRIGDIELYATIYLPPHWEPSDERLGVLFFGGGGWRTQSRTQFERQSRYLAPLGFVVVCADYRTRNPHGAGVPLCVEDAKSAVRWMRLYAPRLGIDAGKIVASGGSAGGHIAACSATVGGFDATDEEASVSSVPNALVLFNPALDLVNLRLPPDVAARVGPFDFGTDPGKISPLQNLREGTAPTIIFHGTQDRSIRFSQAEAFERKMAELGNYCRLFPAEGEGHAFFNHAQSAQRSEGKWYRFCIENTAQFLEQLDRGKLPQNVNRTRR